MNSQIEKNELGNRKIHRENASLFFPCAFSFSNLVSIYFLIHFLISLLYFLFLFSFFLIYFLITLLYFLIHS